MTEHRLSFIQKFFLKVSKVSCLKCFWKFILIISLNLVLIFLIMTSLVSVFFWCFNKFLAFHISFSIVIWIVRRIFLTFLSLTRAFRIRTQFVNVIFAALLSIVVKWKKCFHILYYTLDVKSQIVRQLKRLLVSYVLYNRYQVPLYLWWMETLLKYWKVPEYHVQDCSRTNYNILVLFSFAKDFAIYKIMKQQVHNLPWLKSLTRF